MEISKNKSKLLKLNYLELKSLATENNRLGLFLKLSHEGGYDEISKELGVYDEYLDYEKEVIRLMAIAEYESVVLNSNYRLFLLEKICFE